MSVSSSLNRGLSSTAEVYELSYAARTESTHYRTALPCQHAQTPTLGHEARRA